MSRNLGRTTCYFCGGEVVPEQAMRPITMDEARCYFDEYRGMLVANSHCKECLAKYLRWDPERTGIADLSFRSTFDDEAGPEDLPVYEVRRVYERVGPHKP